jgi:hypothetical protein
MVTKEAVFELIRSMVAQKNTIQENKNSTASETKKDTVISSTIDDPNARVGVVIGTFAAVPYVHLSLATLRKHEPDIRIMVHDDCSPAGNKLKELCEQYGAAYYSLSFRHEPTVGDLSALVNACTWSYDNNCKIGIKLSRRYIINRPFVSGLQELFYNMQIPTVCGACATFGFGYRSECVAMWTPSWIASGLVEEMKNTVSLNKQYSGLPEGWYHEKARKVYEFSKNEMRKKYDNFYPIPDTRAAFTEWPLMGLGRGQKTQNILWHDSHTAKDYWELSQQLNLPYSLEQFQDPNMGYGLKPI